MSKICDMYMRFKTAFEKSTYTDASNKVAEDIRLEDVFLFPIIRIMQSKYSCACVNTRPI